MIVECLDDFCLVPHTTIVYRDDNKISFSRPSRPLEKDTDTGVILQHSAIEKAPVSAKELPLTTWQIVKIASMNIFRRDDGVV